MFGYVKIDKQELLVKDYETYKAVYCGLCKTLGKRYSVFSRMLLNYDYTFFGVLMLACRDEAPEMKNQGCLFNPLCKKNCCTRVSSLDRAADALILTSYFKLNDSVADSKHLKRVGYKFLRLLFKPLFKKAKKYAPDICDILESYMAKQTAVENKKEACLDEAAEPTSYFMADLLETVSPPDTDKRILRHLGYNLGKWIYITDALDDIKDDIKTESFNPIIREYSINKDTDLNALSQIAADTGKILDTCVYEAAKAVDLLNVKRYEMIIKNVIYMGLPAEQGRVTRKLLAE